MPGPSDTLPALEQRLAERLLDFETVAAAWPKGRTAIARAEIGREREEALYEIASLRQPCCPPRGLGQRRDCTLIAAVRPGDHDQRLVVRGLRPARLEEGVDPRQNQNRGEDENRGHDDLEG